MRLDKLKSKLERNTSQKKSNKENKATIKALNNLTIIGITGSRGKSSVAYIVHQYLSMLGYKSMLYSSAMIDSKVSMKNKDESCEVSFNSEEGLLEIIKEALKYKAEYLVLEVNENTIKKGLVKDIPFNLRVLTNLNPKHNLDQYTEDEYIKIKSSFFEDIGDECKCVIGLQNYSKELFERLLTLNNAPKITFSSEYIASVNNVNQNKITCLLNKLDNSLNGLDMNIKINEKNVHLKTKMMMNYNAMNFVCVVAILQALNLFDENKLNECISDITIPGRAEIYHTNNRLIIVDVQLSMMLEELSMLKDKGLLKKIKVVVGSTGTGFENWEERFKTHEYISNRALVRKYACDLLSKYADYVYLTENDNAAESVRDICIQLQSYLCDSISSIIIEDRHDAIRKAIIESDEGDVIFISGRGNRRVLCNTATTMKLIKDSEVVEGTLKELGWEYHG